MIGLTPRLDAIEATFFTNYSLLTSSSFPDTTNLYGWHMNETSFSNGNPWIGSQNFTQVGSITSAPNHLGQSVACDFDGTNDYLSNTDASFDDTGSFTFGAWIKLSSSPNSTMCIVSKDSGTTAEKSFQVRLDSGNLYTQMWYNSSGGVSFGEVMRGLVR